MSNGQGENEKQGVVDVRSTAELFARAYEIEVDAEARYRDLADQMETHNNARVAALFLHFAKAEAKHAAEIAARMKEMGIAVDASQEFNWSGGESPETVDTLDVHYRMTPYHAFELALVAEQRAFEFFDEVAKNSSDEDVRQWAQEFADEEAGHVRYIESCLEKEKKPDHDWADDFDDPVIL